MPAEDRLAFQLELPIKYGNYHSGDPTSDPLALNMAAVQSCRGSPYTLQISWPILDTTIADNAIFSPIRDACHSMDRKTIEKFVSKWGRKTIFS